ncbi:MAG: hypothetical protein GY924_11095 [Planctomycetaceae bacterium]|nr:hypothetical protein [Planctomycetaceae bacterium]
MILKLSHPLNKVASHRPPDDLTQAITTLLSPTTINEPITQNTKDRKKRLKTEVIARKASSYRTTHRTANCDL